MTPTSTQNVQSVNNFKKTKHITGNCTFFVLGMVTANVICSHNHLHYNEFNNYTKSNHVESILHDTQKLNGTARALNFKPKIHNLKTNTLESVNLLPAYTNKQVPTTAQESVILRRQENLNMVLDSALETAYRNMVKFVMKKDINSRRFIIVESHVGFGNKLRGIGGALLLALKEERIVLLGTNMEWIYEFYNFDILSVHQASQSNETGLKYETMITSARKNIIPFERWHQFVNGMAKNERFWLCEWGSIPHDFYQFSIWDGCFGLVPKLNKERMQIMPNIGCPHRVKFCGIDSAGTFRNLLPITQWHTGAMTTKRISAKFDMEIHRLKDRLQWQSYEWIGLQIRACVDCGSFRIPPEQIQDALFCLQDKIRLRKKASTKPIAIFLATDDSRQFKTVEMFAETHNVTLGYFKKKSPFIQTDHGGTFKKMLAPMTDFHMLGECSFIVAAHLTTFSKMAASRKGIKMYTVRNGFEINSTQFLSKSRSSSKCLLGYPESFFNARSLQPTQQCGKNAIL